MIGYFRYQIGETVQAQINPAETFVRVLMNPMVKVGKIVDRREIPHRNIHEYRVRIWWPTGNKIYPYNEKETIWLTENRLSRIHLNEGLAR